MILYATSSWGDVLLRWHGTVLQKIILMWMLFVVYVGSIYFVQVCTGIQLGCNAKHGGLLGKGLSFLLVFRANSAYMKYKDALDSCVQFFGNLRFYAMLSSVLFKGGRGQYVWNRQLGDVGFSLEQRQSLDDFDDHALSHVRVEFSRYCMAMAVSFALHIRLSADSHLYGRLHHSSKAALNWDRMRLRTLLTQLEFDIVDQALRVEHTAGDEELYSGVAQPHVFHRRGGGFGWYGGHNPKAAAAADPMAEDRHYHVSMEPSYRQMMMLLTFSLKLVLRHCNQQYGCRERFMGQFFASSTELMEIHERVHGAVTVPLPLPYVNLVRILLLTYLLSMPFVVDPEEGFFANVVMPCLSGLALLGIDQIGTEFEIPFGSGPNTIDVQEMLSTLEMELLRMLDYSGDIRAREAFAWMPVPEFIREQAQHPFYWYLGLKEEVKHLSIPRYRGGGNSHVRVRHVEVPPVSTGGAQGARRP